MSKARNISDKGHIVGRKNLIINGGFDVWQRGTTGSAVSNFMMVSADRWDAVRTSLDQEIDSYGNSYAHCVCGNFADTNYLSYNVEHPRKLLGKVLTVSFKIKSDDGLGSNAKVWARYYNSSNTYTVPLDTAFTYSSSWTTVAATFTMPTTPVKSDNYGLQIFIAANNASTNDNTKSFDVKEVQLELGSVATDFEHRSYGEELALCQRYYETAGSSHWATLDGSANVQYSFNPIYNFAVTKRVAPTLSLTVTAGVTYQRIGLSVNGFDLRNTSTNQSGYADKYLSWTADSEL